MLTTITAAALIALAPLTGPQEDDPGWDCRTMGDHVCGVGNSQGVAPGLYDQAGALVDPTVTRCWLDAGQSVCGTPEQAHQ